MSIDGIRGFIKSMGEKFLLVANQIDRMRPQDLSKIKQQCSTCAKLLFLLALNSRVQLIACYKSYTEIFYQIGLAMIAQYY